MKKIVCLLLSLLALTSCRSPSCMYDVCGPDEFVIDSYSIREGKLAILEMMGYCVDDLNPAYLCEYRDVIREDDVLNIFAFHPTRKDLMGAFEYINCKIGGFEVIDGYVDLPDIPPVFVEGMNIVEAKNELQRVYSEQIADIELFVSYKNRGRQKVELAGMVGVTSIPVDGKMRLYDVISKAKIHPQANLFMSYVSRNCQKLPIDLHKLINEGDMCQNIVMRGGDKVYIASPSDAVVMVMGEVNRPTAIPVPYGFISLPEAIVSAFGIPFTGNRRNIQIIRGDLQCPKIYTISWDHIVHLPNDSMLLMPGDTVYVSEKPITQWNRFISQLLPSVYGVRDGYTTYSLFN